MKIAFFSTRDYEKPFFNHANLSAGHQLTFFKEGLNPSTINMAHGFDVVCTFVNDALNSDALTQLKNLGVKLIALRCAGYNQVDTQAAIAINMPIVRVPAYSPYAVAEHTIGMILTLNRKLHRAYLRSLEHNFSLQGLMGFDLHGKTIGIIGTGKIGSIFANIMKGFGCSVIAYDIYENPECLNIGVSYTTKEHIFANADIISLHCPLTPETHHLINSESIQLFKSNAMLINTSRGGLIHTKAVIQGLKDKKIGSLGIDVYEEEADIFFENLSDEIILDDVFMRLLTFPNVFVTGHQAYFTKEANNNIAKTTIDNISAFATGKIENAIE